MLNARFVPIDQWPGKPTLSGQRQGARFRSNYLSTLDLLESELAKIRAKAILIEAYFTREQLRNDGWPRNTSIPTQPGVVISFDSPKGHLSFPCDRYTDYQDNLRAIGLALEALRAVDRYGVTRGAEQYKGWAQIEAPSDTPKPDFASVFMEQHSGFHAADIYRKPDVFRAAYREAARRLHPDGANGSNEAFIELSRAKEALEKHHGL